MLRNLELRGALGKKYGRHHRFDVSSIPEAMRAMNSQHPGFFEDLKSGTYKVYRGDIVIDESLLRMGLGKTKKIIVEPVAIGSKNGGVGKVILGVAMIAAAVYFAPAAIAGASGTGLGATAFTVAGANVSFGSIALFGASLALGGIGQVLSPIPKVGSYEARERPDQRPSFLFNGAQNTIEQGAAIPLVYGRIRTGSVVVSTGLTTEDVNV